MVKAGAFVSTTGEWTKLCHLHFLSVPVSAKHWAAAREPGNIGKVLLPQPGPLPHLL